jgi:hypothetical protein
MGNHWPAYPLAFGLAARPDGRLGRCSHKCQRCRYLPLAGRDSRAGWNQSLSIELRWCSDEAFATAEILKIGKVAEHKCDQGKFKTTPTAAAGELVVFARRVTRWERVWREIP